MRARIFQQADAGAHRTHASAADVRAMFERGVVEQSRLARLFDAVEPELYRYPALNPVAFRRKVRDALVGT